MGRIGQVAKLLKETDKFRKDNDRVLRVVGYARFSNPHKVDNFFTSVEAQEAIIREYGY